MSKLGKEGHYLYEWNCFKLEKAKLENSVLLQSKREQNVKRGILRTVGFQILSLEREYLTPLYIYGRSDHRNSSRQEGKLLYAERPTRGLLF